MKLFLQILAANAVLVFLLIAVHECGHWCVGRLLGVPGDRMRIRLFTFPQQVQIREGNDWLSVDTFERYFAVLRKWVPAGDAQFAYVAGGFVFETLFLTGLTVTLGYLGHWLYAMVAPAVSLTMYLIYVLAMDLPQSRALRRPWGDSTILYWLAPRRAAWVAGVMVSSRLVLMLCAAAGWLA